MGLRATVLDAALRPPDGIERVQEAIVVRLAGKHDQEVLLGRQRGQQFSCVPHFTPGRRQQSGRHLAGEILHGAEDADVENFFLRLGQHGRPRRLQPIREVVEIDPVTAGTDHARGQVAAEVVKVGSHLEGHVGPMSWLDAGLDAICFARPNRERAEAEGIGRPPLFFAAGLRLGNNGRSRAKRQHDTTSNQCRNGREHDQDQQPAFPTLAQKCQRSARTHSGRRVVRGPAQCRVAMVRVSGARPGIGE